MKIISFALASLTASFCLHSVSPLQADSAPFDIYDENGEDLGTFYHKGNDINSWIEDEDGYTICMADGGSGVRDRRHLSAEHAAQVRARRRTHEVKPRTKHGVKVRTKHDTRVHTDPDNRGYNEDNELVYYYCMELGEGKIGPNYTLPVHETYPEEVGIAKHIHRSLNAAAEEGGEDCKLSLEHGGVAVDDDSKNRKLRGRELSAPKEGVLKNLVIPFKFAGHESRNVPSRSDLDTLMNAMDPVPGIAPTGGVKKVYHDNSGGKLQIESTVIDWIQLTGEYDESYCTGAKFNGQHGTNTYLKTCLVEVLKQVDKVVNFKDFDVNLDHYIDAIAFLHSGYDSSQCQGRNDLIWSHMGGLNQQYYTSDEGIYVNPYHINPSLSGCEGDSIGTIATIAHETGHFLGLVDLYDRNNGGNGVGSWSLMAASNGFHSSNTYPPMLDPFSKEQLGWGTFTEISTSQNKVTLTPSATSHNYIKITQGFSSNEYLLLENRQQLLFDKHIPAAGLLIWHIDKDKSGVQNDDEGHPGQGDWPQNGRHYMAAILAADGEYRFEKQRVDAKGDMGDPYGSCLKAQNIGPTTVPNTQGYQGGNIKNTDISIKNIHDDGNGNMVFDVCFGACAAGSEAPPATECCKDKEGWVAAGWTTGTGASITCDNVVYLTNGCNTMSDANGVSGSDACCGCKSYPDNILA